VVTLKAIEKIALARHNTGTMAKISQIALGTEGVDSNGEIRTPLPQNIGLNNEIIRKSYASSTQTSNASYSYDIRLTQEELIGVPISEIALVDEDGDVVAIANFKPRIKGESEVFFSMEIGFM